ncbi:MAG: GtrA family protein [Rikenellaceae bacterium]|nr:GtrA family protein [Rikenellaceae bacterium]MDE7355989.1 GtrA family protein [Rikenellaceae bacterium]
MMARLIKRIYEFVLRYEFVKFAVVGGTSFALHWGIYVLLMAVGWSYNPAYITGYILSFIYNFFASSLFTFKTKPTLLRGIGFALCNAVNFGLHVLLLNVYVSVGVAEWIAPPLVLAVAVPVNFVLVRFVMKNSRLG